MIFILFSFIVLAFKAAALADVACDTDECSDVSQVKPRVGSAMLQKFTVNKSMHDKHAKKEADFVLIKNGYECDTGYKVINSQHVCQVAADYLGLELNVVIEHSDSGDPHGCWGYSDEAEEEFTHLYFNFGGTTRGSRARRHIICAKPKYKSGVEVKEKVTKPANPHLPQCTGYFFWYPCNGCEGTPIPNDPDGLVYYHYYTEHCSWWGAGWSQWQEGEPFPSFEEEDYSWLYEEWCGETCPGTFCAETVCPQCGKCAPP